MHQNLVGQTVQFSPQNRKDGGNNTRTLNILGEYIEDSKRWYRVQDVNSKEEFPACANTYDRFFLLKKQLVVAKNGRVKGNHIYSPNHPDYKLQK